MVAVVSFTDAKPKGKRKVGKLVVSYLTHTDGVAASASIPFNGVIQRIATNPTDAHTASWDATVIDEDGLDLAQGLLANRHTTNSEEVTPLIGTTHLVPYNGLLIVNIAAAGSGKNGVVTIYYQ
jgi:hypothetical protein